MSSVHLVVLLQRHGQQPVKHTYVTKKIRAFFPKFEDVLSASTNNKVS
jgi:hypothetical protein